MRTEILITADHDETRAAVLEDGTLVEFYVERPLVQRTVGNIYKGRVENVLPGMQAAFVNIGLEKNAFLYVADAHPLGVLEGEDELPEDLRQASIKDLLRVGQEVVVQVEKEPAGTKGARVTRHLTLPGRFVVLMPGVEYVGVSRKIQDEAERERLRELAAALRPAGHGLIVRTAAAGHGEDDLRRDVRFLLGRWNAVQQRARTLKAPALLHRDPGLVYRLVRDLFTEQVERVLVDAREPYEQVLELLDAFAPELKARVELYAPPGGGSVFDAFGIDEELDRALKRRVWLKSGGYLVIDQTEAFTVIDVNTGKYVGTTNLHDTVLKTNLEAAAEVARQLRLRDIGGIVVIDFIDMDVAQHRRKVVQELEQALQRDRMRGQVLGLTRLGLVEMTRKKAGRSLLDQMTHECPYCDGRGRVFTAEAMARRVRREIRRLLRAGKAEAILVEVHPAVAAQIIGSGGANLRELERELGRSVFVRGSDACHVEDMKVRAMGSRQEVEAQALPVRAGQVLELKVEEPHASNGADGIARVQGYVIDIEGAGDRVGQTLRVEITRAFRTYAKARVLAPAGAGAGRGAEAASAR